MLSCHAIFSPQPMQADGGETTERRSGTRAATTFRKLPSASPGATKKAAIAMSILNLLSARRQRELRLSLLVHARARGFGSVSAPATPILVEPDPPRPRRRR